MMDSIKLRLASWSLSISQWIMPKKLPCISAGEAGEVANGGNESVVRYFIYYAYNLRESPNAQPWFNGAGNCFINVEGGIKDAETLMAVQGMISDFMKTTEGIGSEYKPATVTVVNFQTIEQ
jgi:hypothetical protein